MKTFFFNAGGRLNRARFWLGQLGIAGFIFAAMNVTLVLAAVPQAIEGGKNLAVDIVCYALAMVVMLASFGLMIWASLCLGIKRYHDRGKPGVWVLIQLAPFIGGIWYFIEAFCLPGTYGANPYGVDPLNPGVGSAAAAVEAARAAAVAPVSTDRPGWVVPVLLVPAAFALLLTVGAVVWAGATQSWLAAATKVEGKVVELRPGGKSQDGHDMYRAVMEARTSDGVPIRITDFWATYPSSEVGEVVSLAYPTGQPERAIRLSFPNLWFGPTMLGGFGGVGLLFWLIVALLVKLLWKRQPPRGVG